MLHTVGVSHFTETFLLTLDEINLAFTLLFSYTIKKKLYLIFFFTFGAFNWSPTILDRKDVLGLKRGVIQISVWSAVLNEKPPLPGREMQQQSISGSEKCNQIEMSA